MRIVVCGGRTYTDMDKVDEVLRQINPTEIAHGGSTGADRLAAKWAEGLGVPHTTFAANWLKYGPSAGPMRNEKMLRDFQPDLVVAFPGGPGTESCINKACSFGIDVRIIP